MWDGVLVFLPVWVDRRLTTVTETKRKSSAIDVPQMKWLPCLHHNFLNASCLNTGPLLQIGWISV